MAEQCDIVPLGGHEYLIRVRTRAQVVESRFQATEKILEALHVTDDGEQRLIEETMDFLAARHPVTGLPGLVDLDDIAASYDDYLDVLRRRLPAS